MNNWPLYLRDGFFRMLNMKLRVGDEKMLPKQMKLKLNTNWSEIQACRLNSLQVEINPIPNEFSSIVTQNQETAVTMTGVDE